MASCRKFSFTLISATHLPDVRNSGSMKVYAKVSLRVKANTERQTSIDKLNGTNPKWNHIFEYWISHSSLREGPGVILDVKLYCERTFGDRFVGQVNINLKELFEGSFSNTTHMNVKVDDSQTTEGTIEFSYNFGDSETINIDFKELDKQSLIQANAAVASMPGTLAAVLTILGS